MYYVGLLVLIVLACLISFSVQGCRNSKLGGGSSSQMIFKIQEVDSLSKEKIEQALQNLQQQKAPKAMTGAMCYIPAPIPLKVEYLCPTCGQKTLYTQGDALAQFVNWELGACRRELDRLDNRGGLKITLEESSFCAKCSPNAGKHELVLKITYPDGSIHSTGGIQLTDLRMLNRFLGGYLSFDESEPLKDHISRLRDLLGIENPALQQKL
ncbi:MAG: hypothetical protein GX455_07675 [Phycisphaerae bacterium]|nr:hypothetical protein [Phycisphaerae bacterium]